MFVLALQDALDQEAREEAPYFETSYRSAPDTQYAVKPEARCHGALDLKRPQAGMPCGYCRFISEFA
ncbi:hypothetical protein P3T23_001553 [Paraburkholderia sp. GAS448]|jgi:hypothetical protein